MSGEPSSPETAAAVYSLLKERAATGDVVAMSNRDIGALLGIGRSTSCRALSLLVDTGRIELMSPGRGHRYPAMYRIAS